MRRRRFSVVLVAFCISWSLAIVARGQAPAAIERPASVNAEARIREALDDIATLEYIETPLRDVIEVIKDAHEIPIVIDVKALDDVGISTDIPITRDLKGITLRSALRTLLRDLDLAYIVENEALIITTAAAAAERPVHRVYLASGILPGAGEDAAPLAELVGASLARPSASGQPTLSVETYGPLLIVRGTEEDLDRVALFLWRISSALHGEPEQRQPRGPRPGRAPSAEDPFGARPNSPAADDGEQTKPEPAPVKQPPPTPGRDPFAP